MLDIHRSINFMVGDLNRKVGWRELGDEEAMSAHGYGIRNDRVERLIHFAQAHEMKILNTFFKKKSHKRWTWRSPDRKALNEIDYIIGDTLEIVRDMQVVQRLKFDTDHKMI